MSAGLYHHRRPRAGEVWLVERNYEGDVVPVYLRGPEPSGMLWWRVIYLKPDVRTGTTMIDEEQLIELRDPPVPTDEEAAAIAALLLQRDNVLYPDRSE